MATSSEAVDFKKMKVQELRDELKKRGLDTTGLKPVLLSRLEEDTQKAPSEQGPEEAGDGLADPVEGKSEQIQPTSTTAPTPAGSAAAAAAAPAAPQQSEAEKAKKRLHRFGDALAGQTQGPSKASGEAGANAANDTAPAAVAKAVKEDDPGEIARRKDRAKRFGMPTPTFASEEQEKRKARAARFEVAGSGTTEDQKAKLEARKQRFGSAAPAANGSTKAEADTKLAARAKRFGSGSIDSAEQDAKKKARAERFAAS